MTASTPSDDPYDLDFAHHFSPENRLPEPVRTSEELKEIDDLGSIGAAALKDQGFYARIVTPRKRKGARSENTTILVVEDDPGTSMVIAKALQSSGYHPRVARDRRGIVTALGEMPRPELILLDVMLPDINGFDVLNRIRRHRTIHSMPIIMLTTLSDSADIARGLSLGADGYLTKPILPSTLLDAVQTVLAG